MATAPIIFAAAALTDPHDVFISSAASSLFHLYHKGIGSLFAGTELSDSRSEVQVGRALQAQVGDPGDP
ncbi:uncharacterized protein RHOBADRAFT_52848 [Rhodotorula graminis WP1]|uniref:Uncharacterized protein n=1 Tax=Rhodotorula graminis (strain WP1) TaxID=578459 RepID=A0A194S8U2_RHOGW|nr:uncharacterized protein RHOBADRAFT_52848 [Rhodotorula graminis WP1]KPV75826.1 hypothetical protein RHOBADRAFT_52848 [Rhodotorula graminis WP1]